MKEKVQRLLQFRDESMKEDLHYDPEEDEQRNQLEDLAVQGSKVLVVHPNNPITTTDSAKERVKKTAAAVAEWRKRVPNVIKKHGVAWVGVVWAPEYPRISPHIPEYF